MLCELGRTKTGSTTVSLIAPAHLRGRKSFSSATFKRFLSDRAGSTMPIFIMALLPTVAAVGMMTDLGRSYSIKNQMTVAMDAATLVGGRTFDATGNIDAANKATVAYFAKVLPKTISAKITSIKLDSKGNVTLAAKTSVKTLFLGAVGVNTINVDSQVQSQTVTVTSPVNVEVALVVDNTSGMTGAALANAKLAASALVNTLLPASGAGNNTVRVSLVPFSDNVNIGTVALATAATGVTNPPPATYSCPTTSTVTTPVSPPPTCTKTVGTDPCTGLDTNGYDAHGYNTAGYDHDGFDRDGYDVDGRDEHARDHWGYDEGHHYVDKSAVAGAPRTHTPRLNGDQCAQHFGQNGQAFGHNDRMSHENGDDQRGAGAMNAQQCNATHGGSNEFEHEHEHEHEHDHEHDHDGDRGDDKDNHDQWGNQRHDDDASGNPNGYQADNVSFGRDGYDSHGYDRYGYDHNGYDHNGHDQDGYDANGMDHHSRDHDGYDQDGRDKDGFDHDGYDHDGFDKHGCDHGGKDRWHNVSPAGVTPKAPGISCANTSGPSTTTTTVTTPKTCTAQSYLTTCMAERLATGPSAYTDDAPATAVKASLFHAFTTTTAANWNCPSPAAPVTPLSNKASVLNAAIAAWATPPVGTGAGHVGLAWGWYSVSQNWSSFWKSNVSSASAPAAASVKVKKIVVFLTSNGFAAHYDANFQEVFDATSPNPAAANGPSVSQAQQVCANMNKAGIEVFTVGVDANAATKTALSTCATPTTAANAIQVTHNYGVANADLVTTVQTIASQIAAATGTGSQTLRTTQ